MKKGIKKFIKLAKASASKLPKKTARLRDLAQNSDKGAVLVKLRKDGVAEPRKGKAGATHVVIETPTGGAVAEPIGRWPKPPKQLVPAQPMTAGDDVPSPHDVFASPIPEGATYLGWQAGGALMLEPVKFLAEYRHRKGGKLSVGKLRYGEDFVILSPAAEAGNVIRWRDGITCFAEGQSPDELKKAERAALQAAERRANPPEHVKAAFKEQAQKRKAAPGPRPGDIEGKIQSGVRKPGAGGKTARVWEICDELFKKLGRVPTKAEVFAISVDKEKASPGMTGTNYSYWKRFYGRA